MSETTVSSPKHSNPNNSAPADLWQGIVQLRGNSVFTPGAATGSDIRAACVANYPDNKHSQVNTCSAMMLECCNRATLDTSMGCRAQILRQHETIVNQTCAGKGSGNEIAECSAKMCTKLDPKPKLMPEPKRPKENSGIEKQIKNQKPSNSGNTEGTTFVKR